MSVTNVLEQFVWKPQPAAQALVRELLEQVLTSCPPAAELSRRMKDDAGSRMIDWIDHIRAPRSAGLEARLRETGYEKTPQVGAPECYNNPLGIFPAIVLDAGTGVRVGIKVDSVADFAATWGLTGPVVGEPLGQFRTVLAWKGTGGAELWAVERHGWRGFEPPKFDAAKSVRSLVHLENLRRRRRDFDEDAQGFAEVYRLVDAAIADLGVDWACDVFFYAERDYWQRRNRAAQVQYARQARLGLGWANHDHHTYRCSRENFTRLIGLWEKLGFKARERFYAGHEAGWGAQVMEQAVTGITTFNDVDMSPEELLGDFAHTPMEPRKELGTVGLWCALHGEAALQAGMHHLECMFDWHALVDQLERTAHIKTMAPFTTFPYLRQAFTEGERWPVSEARITKLVDAGRFTREQGEQFRVSGAIGSHLENLERNDGYKGFNQKGVSDIIARTDPRKQGVLVGA